MDLVLLTTLLLSIVNCCQSFNEQRISKIVCSLRRSKHVDILKLGPMDSILLIKSLFQECDIKIRIVSENRNVETTDFISFAYHQSNNKENQSTLLEHQIVSEKKIHFQDVYQKLPNKFSFVKPVIFSWAKK